MVLVFLVVHLVVQLRVAMPVHLAVATKAWVVVVHFMLSAVALAMVVGGVRHAHPLTVLQLVLTAEVEQHVSVLVQHAHTDAGLVAHHLIASALQETTARVAHVVPDIVVFVRIAMELEVVIAKLVQQDLAVLVEATAMVAAVAFLN